MTAELAPAEFDVCGPLPTGVTVLEASAGTGKTYTIAALAARYVADGIPLHRLLLVTFTRIATGELRERVRDRLVRAERGLGLAIDGVLGAQDHVVSLLANGSPAEVQERRERLAHAVAGFDAATIATTHGFCQEMLGGLGIAGDLEPDVTFVEDLSDLAAEVVDDLYLRKFSRELSPAIELAEARRIAWAVIDNPTVKIVASDSEQAKLRGGLARAVRDELEARKRGLAVMTYDDLVTRLRSTLSGDGGAAAAAALCGRYDVVLVDEFQDTDPAQWDILRLAFADMGVTLVLIADPKQAIYAFRGADVYAYLEAAAAAQSRSTLPINWRSDQRLIDAHDALLSGVKLGHPGIAYRQVQAAPRHQGSRLVGAPVGHPMRIRVALREDQALSLTPRGYVRKPSATEHIVRDLAADVVRLLDSRATVPDHGDRPPIQVRPGHIAVLVRANRQAAMVRDALDEAAVPAVINGAGSVFATEPARAWLSLLEALERPAAMSRARAAALTPFVGWTADQLALADADGGRAWEAVHQRLHDWARVLRWRGVASLLTTIVADERLPARILARSDGEREMTDLRHLGELLHGAATAEQLGVTALTGWLRTRIAEAGSDTADEERSRRLESDAEAVQVLTIHRSKGLEFPITYVPFLWEPGWIPEEARPVFFHDPAAGDERTIDVSLQGAEFDRHKEQDVAEQRGEDLRLAYVALTRARHQVIVWWTASYDTHRSPLTRLLFARDEHGDIAPEGSSPPSDADLLARLRTVAERSRGAIGVEPATLGTPATWQPPVEPVADLTASAFDRSLDLRWRRTSYTDITAAAHEAWVTSEPEDPLVSDEPPSAVPVSPAAADPAGGEPDPVPLTAMAVGAEVGTFVHRLLEATDFTAADLTTELTARIGELQARRAVDVGDLEAVTTGLAAAIRTPLGPIFDGLRLRDFERADRLDELTFELPLAGGDDPRGWAELSRLAAILDQFLDGADPLAGYARRLRDGDLRQSVRGYLTGSLDLVVRLPAAAEPQFAVFDYKTNWLGEFDAPLSAPQYRAALLAIEMQRHHYVLQALLYLVALHRYLRWRVPGYSADAHIAGVGYLFLRGMTGADVPVLDGAPCGVFGWRPPTGLVTALSDALDAGEGR